LGNIEISIDSVALFETNRIRPSAGAQALTLITGISLAFTAFCIMNPKACFGSCPTFYASDGEKMILQAEGFSSSVAPALEARDIDALYRASPTSDSFEILMTNEALETHVVRYADLLSAPKPVSGRVFATCQGDFWQGDQITAPVSCTDDYGDCLEKIYRFDSKERFSLADSTDLATSEIMELEFENIHGKDWGIVIAARQSLLTTFLFYQTLSYLGSNAGACLAAMGHDNGILREGYRKYAQVLGGLEVLVEDSAGNWEIAGNIHETGPIAIDVHLLPLPGAYNGRVKLRIKQSRGAWRVDYIAMTRLISKVEPVRIKPDVVMFNGEIDADAKSQLLSAEKTLVTLPGDSVSILFNLPIDFSEYEFFLESRGYYLEWMREEWLSEENLAMAALVYNNPREALKILAPKFKEIEPEIENSFWSSRYAK
jgi:hypothetical protein